MIKKLSIFSLVIFFSGILIWEYKLNILLWSMPKIGSIIMPVHENIPTTWATGPEVSSQDDRPNINQPSVR